MADTRVQTEVEDWVRREWMVKRFGQTFHRDRVRLFPGGVFDFDAVSADGKTIATISTSGSVTATGKYAVGKMMKTRSDMYFPLLADAERRIVVLTEKDRFDQCANSHMQRPFDLEARLLAARKKASTEMTPPTEPGIGRG